MRSWPLENPAGGPPLLDDTVAFCASFVRRSVKRDLNAEDREDLLQELAVACWRAARTFDPAKAKFTSYATGVLSHTAVTWERRTFKRTRWVFKTHVYERELPTFVELGEQHGAVAAPGMDPAERGDPADERLVPGGDIPDAAYDPPGGARSGRRVRRPPADPAKGDDREADK